MQCPGIVIRVRPSGYVGSIQDAMKLWEEDAFCRLGLETGRADKFLCAAMRQIPIRGGLSSSTTSQE
jgi:hypothetical protein